MTVRRTLGSAALLALALVALGSTQASATVLCKTTPTGENTRCPSGQMYTSGTVFKGALKAGTEAVFSAGGFSARCTGSALTVKSTTTGSSLQYVNGEVSGLTFTGCTSKQCETAPVITAGELGWSFFVATKPEHDGSAEVSSFRIRVACRAFLVNVVCEYAGGETSVPIGHGAPATLSVNEISAPVVEGAPMFCGLAGTWDAEYTFSEPNALYVAISE